jgi:hypothetical protein
MSPYFWDTRESILAGEASASTPAKLKTNRAEDHPAGAGELEKPAFCAQGDRMRKKWRNQ